MGVRTLFLPLYKQQLHKDIWRFIIISTLEFSPIHQLKAISFKMARMTIRDLGYTPGQLPAGPKNSILDVKGQCPEISILIQIIDIQIGVRVGQVTVGSGNSHVLKGVTVILPRHPDEISIPCCAGMHTLNGNGEVSGSYQIKDWGFTNTVCAFLHPFPPSPPYSSFNPTILSPNV